MSNDLLIRQFEGDCPICDKVHKIEERKAIAQAIVKGEVVDYEEIYFLCPISDVDGENTFVPAGLMDENLLRARDAYRVKKGLLTSKEIAAIRNYYGLTQSDLAALLGWGEVTVTRYESKAIQDQTYDEILRIVYQNPLFALESLDKHKDRFPSDKLTKIREIIKTRVTERGSVYLTKQIIDSLYVKYQELTDLNGYKAIDIKKLSNVICYFAQNIDRLYKVKLMKLLWYADSIFFRRYGRSMTGLVYKHMPLGALPLGFDQIMSLPTVKVVEKLINEDVAYRIYPNADVNISDFSPEELNVLDIVTKKFDSFSTKELVDYMHNEKAYRETRHNQIIPYSLAQQLNELQ